MPESPRQPSSNAALSRLVLLIAIVAVILVALFALRSCSQPASQSQAGNTGAAATAISDAEQVVPTAASVKEDALTTTTVQGTTDQTASAQSGTDTQIDGLREYYVDTDKAQSCTVMVYMCGADLETYNSAASKDIIEMSEANLGDNVKVVIQTGGAKRWHFTDMASSRTRQRWAMDGQGMYLVDDAGAGTMLDTASVTDFATWAANNYPADRYMFYFWDHGGGTIGGYGSDEVYPNANPLTLLELRTALADSGLKFDMVGFDACLMGTIETAYAMEPVADYLLASEEYEMGDGWSWTGFLSALGANPAINTVDLGKVAIDDFTKYYFGQRLGNITLSLVDLREVPHAYEAMGTFLKNAEETIQNDNNRFIEMSQARTKATSFADGGLDQVDVIDLIERTEFEGKADLLAAVQSCVKYRSGTTIAGANGLAMYFPYSEVREYQGMRSILNEIGYVRPTEFYDYFLSVMGNSGGGSTGGGLFSWLTNASGQSGSAESGAASTGTYADQSFSGESWFEALLGSTFNYQQVPDSLTFEYQDGGYVVPMNSAMWNVFSSFQTTVMEEYNGGYLMLGRDDVYDQTDNDDIVVFYNNEWLTIGGQAVSFFASEPTEEANGQYSHSGVIPALLNGSTQIEIVVYWPTESQQGDTYTGYIQGYRQSNPGLFTYGRGLTQFSRGDTITPLFDYYSAQGQYVETTKGNPITINSSSDLEVTYQLFDHNTVHFWGTMTTVYGDKIDTGVITQ